VIVAWWGNRSVVYATSYEARSFGVHSAVPAIRPERLCPDAIFVPPDFHTLSGRFPQREALALDRHSSALDRSSDRFTIFNKAWDIFESIDSVSHTIDLSHHR